MFHQPKELTEIQKVLTDLCAEMILRGGAKNPITNLLTACLGFNCRYLEDNPYVSQERIDNWVDRDIEDWRTKLEASWPKPGDPKPEPDRSTVTKRVRDDRRGELQDSLEDFMELATPEEILLMRQVMMDWESFTRGADANLFDPEIALARAISYTFEERAHYYIRVPDKHWELVEKYIALLERGGKRVA